MMYAHLSELKYEHKALISTTFLDNIRERGILQSILVSPSMVVLDGHHRCSAANLLDIPIPYVIQESSTPLARYCR